MEEKTNPSVEGASAVPSKVGCTCPPVPPPHGGFPPYYPPRPPAPPSGMAEAISALTALCHSLEDKIEGIVDGLPEVRAAIAQEKTERIEEVSTVAQSVASEKPARLADVSALRQKDETLSAEVANAQSFAAQEREQRFAHDNDIRSSISLLRTELKEADAALSQRIDDITQGEDTFLSRIEKEARDRNAADESLARNITELQGEMRAKDSVHTTAIKQMKETIGDWDYSECVADRVRGMATSVQAAVSTASTVRQTVTALNETVELATRNIAQIDAGLLSTNEYVGQSDYIDGLGKSLSAVVEDNAKKIKAIIEGGGSGTGGVTEERVREMLAPYLLALDAQETYLQKSAADGFISASEADGKYLSKTDAASDYAKKSALESAVATIAALRDALTAAVARIASLESRVKAIEDGGVVPPVPVDPYASPVAEMEFDHNGRKVSLAAKIDEEDGTPYLDVSATGDATTSAARSAFYFRCADDGLVYAVTALEDEEDEISTDVQLFDGDVSAVKVYDAISLVAPDGKTYSLTVVNPDEYGATTDLSLKPA